LVENKNKIPTFWVENKYFSQNFVFALEKLVFCCLDPDLNLEKYPGSGSVKNESGSETLINFDDTRAIGVPYAPQRWFLSLGKCLLKTGDVASFADILEVGFCIQCCGSVAFLCGSGSVFILARIRILGSKSVLVRFYKKYNLIFFLPVRYLIFFLFFHGYNRSAGPIKHINLFNFNFRILTIFCGNNFVYSTIPI